jgi:hypothetical protein
MPHADYQFLIKMTFPRFIWWRGSRMVRYLREHKVSLQDAKDLFSFYRRGHDFKLNQEPSLMLK